MRRVILFVALFLLGIFVYKSQTPLFFATKSIESSPMYVPSSGVEATVSIIDEGIEGVTHIEITPDGKYMFVSTLRGVIWVYHHIDGQFRRQTRPFFALATSQPGFPPEEAGLTGLTLGADFNESGDIFLAYSFALEKKSFRNRVMRVTFEKQGEKVLGTNPQQIFEANVPGTGSHQIQGGVGVMVAGKPHFLFPIGEGFKAERALDPTQEAGKVMLIAADGAAPQGARPYPEFPKVQALGIRNAPAMAQSPVNGKIAIGDTGPNDYDRFLYGTLFDPEGSFAEKISFNWDGTEDSLKKGAPDLYDNNKDMVLHRWAPTETPVNIVFYENDALPKLGVGLQYVLVNLFGRTGETVNKPGKSIALGVLSEARTNTITFSPLIERAPEGEGKLGHPIGLAVHRATGDLYFGDIMEGRIYKVHLE